MINFKKYLKRINGEITNTCNLCNRELFTKEYFCQDCNSILPYNNEYVCEHCGRKTLGYEKYCNSCKNVNTHFDKARSVFNYEYPINLLIQQLKYGGKKYLAQIFAKEMLPIILKNCMIADILVYTPMTEKHKKERGYNQAQLICESLAKLLECEVCHNAVVKVKDTPSQVGLTRKERINNLTGSFEVYKKYVDGKTVLLVDDVLTTGVTADLISELLKKKGAKEVYVITLASVKTTQ